MINYLRVFKVLGAISLLFLYYFIFYSDAMSDSRRIERREMYFQEKEYKGIVIEKYIDNKNHGDRVLMLSNNLKEIIPGGLYHIYDMSEKGDVLFKERGDSLAYLMKFDTIITFNYMLSIKK